MRNRDVLAAGKVGRRMQAHPARVPVCPCARVPVCNAFLVNAFGDASRLDPSWPSNDGEGMLIALLAHRIIIIICREDAYNK